jgi:hypothetical protein
MRDSARATEREERNTRAFVGSGALAERRRSGVRRLAGRLVCPALALLAAWLSAAVVAGQTIPIVRQPLVAPPGAVLEYVGAGSASARRVSTSVATGCLAAAPGLRSPLAVPKVLGPLVYRMWNASPTFRRQCARLGAAGVTIAVEVDSRMGRERNAFTSIELRSGLVRAAATLLRVLEPEHLAHEIEHVLEQVDGVDLRRSERRGVDGVREVSGGAFETARAVAIGRAVAGEVARGDGGR